MRSYRTSPAERRYDGLTVQVQIPPASWTSRENYIEAHRVFEHRSGCVRLQCDPRKLSLTSGLVVTGVCRGIVRDGEPRGSGVDWYVVIDDCRVTEILWD